MRLLVRSLANPLPKLKEKVLSPEFDSLAFQYGCEPGQLYLAAKGVYSCLKNNPPKLPRSGECKIVENKQDSPYPGWTAHIKCHEDDQKALALYNPTSCNLNFFGTS